MPWQKTTNLGLDTVKLTALHTEVSKQIQNYPDFVKVANHLRKNNTKHLVEQCSA
jgi:hypothetical protein